MPGSQCKAQLPDRGATLAGTTGAPDRPQNNEPPGTDAAVQGGLVTSRPCGLANRLLLFTGYGLFQLL